MRAVVVFVVFVCVVGVASVANAGTPIVTFSGNHEVPAYALRAAMDSPLDSPPNSTEAFDEEALERDLLLISAYYWDRGYANVRVGEPVIDPETNTIAIRIQEGPTFKIGDVAITGTLVGSARTNLGKLSVTRGELFSRTRIANDRESLATYYEDLGYANVMVLPMTKVDLDTRTIAMTWEVTPGQVATIERVNVYDADARRAR
jgi:outer membrane protein insertion porin family